MRRVFFLFFSLKGSALVSRSTRRLPLIHIVGSSWGNPKPQAREACLLEISSVRPAPLIRGSGPSCTGRSCCCAYVDGLAWCAWPDDICMLSLPGDPAPLIRGGAVVVLMWMVWLGVLDQMTSACCPCLDDFHHVTPTNVQLCRDSP